MFRLLDRIYFKLKDKGYEEGYVDGVKDGWGDGYDIGQVNAKSAIETNLAIYNPNLSDKSFQLGYAHAVAVMKGEIK
jgi:hypothetical protein